MKRNWFWLPALALTGCLLFSGASAEEFFSESADSSSEVSADFSEDFFAEAGEEAAAPEETAEEAVTEVPVEIDDILLAEDAETLEERGIGIVECPEGDELPFSEACLTLHFDQTASNSVTIRTEDDKTMNKILSKNKWAVQFRIGEKYTGKYTSFPVKITGLIGNSIYNTLAVRLKTLNKTSTKLPCTHFIQVKAANDTEYLQLAIQKWFKPSFSVKYTAEDNTVIIVAPKLGGEAYKYSMFTYDGFLGYEVQTKDGKIKKFYDAAEASAYGSKNIQLPLTLDAGISTKVRIRAVVDTADGETAADASDTNPNMYFSKWSDWVTVKAIANKWKTVPVKVTVTQSTALQNKVTVKWSQSGVVASSGITYRVEEVGSDAEPITTSSNSVVMDVENRTGKVTYKVTVLYNDQEGKSGTGSVTLKQTWDKTPVIAAVSELAGYSEDGIEINVKIKKQSGVTGYQILDNETELEATLFSKDSTYLIYTVRVDDYGTHSFTCKPMSGTTVGKSVSAAKTYTTVGQNWATAGITVSLKQTYTDSENGTVLVSWKRIPGADGYSIEVKNGEEWEQVATVEDPTSSYELKTSAANVTIGVRAMRGEVTADSISSKSIKLKQAWNVTPKLSKVTPWSTTQKVTFRFTHNYRSTYKIYNVNKEVSESNLLDLSTSLDTATGIETVTVTVRVGNSYPHDNRIAYSLKVRVFGPNGEKGAVSEASTGYCKYNWKSIKLNVDYAQNKTSAKRGFWVIIRNPIPGITKYKFRVFNDANDKELTSFYTDITWYSPDDSKILDEESEASPTAVLARQWEGYVHSETDVTNPGKYYLKVNAVGPDGKLGKTTELDAIKIR